MPTRCVRSVELAERDQEFFLRPTCGRGMGHKPVDLLSSALNAGWQFGRALHEPSAVGKVDARGLDELAEELSLESYLCRLLI